MEKTFLRFEIEIMKLGNLEDVVDRMSMVIYVSAGGDSNVIHINSDGGTERFMLEDNIAIDVVHHGLECCW